VSGWKCLKQSKQNGETIAVQSWRPGEFQTPEKVTRFKYESKRHRTIATCPDVSYLVAKWGTGADDAADLLPVPTKDSASFTSALVMVDVPPGWTVASNARKEGSRFLTDQPESTVFLIGPAIREKSQQLGSNSLSIITSGKWPFSDNDAIKIARQVIDEYSRVTRLISSGTQCSCCFLSQGKRVLRVGARRRGQ